jgi:hypothetical protein
MAQTVMRASRAIRLTDDDTACEDRRMVLMVVIVAAPRHRQWRGLTTLSGDEEADGIDLPAIGIRRIGSALDVVWLHVVVDERDALANRDNQLTRVRSAGCDPDDRRIGRGRGWAGGWSRRRARR